MAAHVSSVIASVYPKVTKQGFYRLLEGCDLVFCSGRAPVSIGIEKLTNSPFSHVLMTWLPEGANQWLTLESTIDKGVHVGLLSDYTDRYDGDLILAERIGLTQKDKLSALNAGFSVLDDAYDWQQEASIVARKLLTALPLIEPQKEFYCSGLMYYMSISTSRPLQKPSTCMPTPEDNWTDPSVRGVCALLKAS